MSGDGLTEQQLGEYREVMEKEKVATERRLHELGISEAIIESILQKMQDTFDTSGGSRIIRPLEWQPGSNWSELTKVTGISSSGGLKMSANEDVLRFFANGLNWCYVAGWPFGMKPFPYHMLIKSGKLEHTNAPGWGWCKAVVEYRGNSWFFFHMLRWPCNSEQKDRFIQYTAWHGSQVVTSGGVRGQGNDCFMDAAVWKDRIYIFTTDIVGDKFDIVLDVYQEGTWDHYGKVASRSNSAFVPLMSAPYEDELLLFWDNPDRGVEYIVLDKSGWQQEVQSVPGTQGYKLATRLDSSGGIGTRAHGCLNGEFLLLIEANAGHLVKMVKYSKGVWSNIQAVPVDEAEDPAFLGAKMIRDRLYLFTSRVHEGNQTLIAYRTFDGDKWTDPVKISGTSDNRGTFVHVEYSDDRLIVAYFIGVGAIRILKSEFERIAKVAKMASYVHGFEMSVPILELHCPQAKGCKATYEEVYTTGGETYFSVNIAGTGGGASQDVSVSYGTVYSTEERCVKIGIPVHVLTTLWVVHELKNSMDPSEDWESVDNWIIPTEKGNEEDPIVEIDVLEGEPPTKAMVRLSSLVQRTHILDVDTDGVAMIPIADNAEGHQCNMDLFTVKALGWQYDGFDMDKADLRTGLRKSFEITSGLSAEFFLGASASFGFGWAAFNVEIKVGVRVRLERTVRVEYLLTGGRDYYRYKVNDNDLIWYWAVCEVLPKPLTCLQVARNLPLKSIAGVGSKTAEILRSHDVITVADLAQISPEDMAADTGLSAWMLRTMKRKAEIIYDTLFEDVYHETLKDWPLRMVLTTDSAELKSLTGRDLEEITNLKGKITSILMFLDSNKHPLLRLGKA